MPLGSAPVPARELGWKRPPGWTRRACPRANDAPLSKGEIALELLDAVRAENVLPGQVVVGDSGYGVSGPLRAGLAARGLHYVLGVTGRDGRLYPRAALAWNRDRAATGVLAAVTASTRTVRSL